MTAPNVGDAGLGPTTTSTGTETPTGQAPATPPTGQPTDPGTQQQPPAVVDASRTFDAKYVEQLRQEAAGHRTKATGLQTEVDALKAEVTKYKEFMPTQVAELETKITALTEVASKSAADAQDANLKYAVAVEAQQQGYVDPEAALALLDKGKLVWENGTPKNVAALLTELLVAKPYLKAAPSAPLIPNAGPTNPGAAHGSPPLTLDDIKKMKPNEINARWTEVAAVMAQAHKK